MISDYQDEMYDRLTNNCWHFVKKVLAEQYGVDIPHTEEAAEAVSPRYITDGPKPGAICLMLHGDGRAHAGVCTGRRNVIELTRRGVSVTPLAEIRNIFHEIRFYDPFLHKA
jgi:cell wall-associated NlpC family hydrolase